MLVFIIYSRTVTIASVPIFSVKGHYIEGYGYHTFQVVMADRCESVDKIGCVAEMCGNTFEKWFQDGLQEPVQTVK